MKSRITRTRCAFTLVELVAVMAVMAAILMTAVASYPSWGRIHSMRASESIVMGELQRARQLAITQNRHVRLSITNCVPDSPRLPYGRISMACSNPDNPESEGMFPVSFGKTNDLPRGVYFVLTEKLDGSPIYKAEDIKRPTSITFKPDGSCAIGGDWRGEDIWCDKDSDKLGKAYEAEHADRMFFIRCQQPKRKNDPDERHRLFRAFAVNRITGVVRTLQADEIDDGKE